MMLNTRSIRTLTGACAVAVVSLGTAGCMTTPAATSPAMMQHASAMHHFATAVHLGEIEEAQLALTSAVSPQVREFAQRMIAEHTPAMQRHQQMGARMGGAMAMGTGTDMGRMRTALMEHPHSRPVVEDHTRAMQLLRATTGAAFDRAYMDRQVAAHTVALQQLDRMLASMGGGMAGHEGHAGAQAGGHASMMEMHRQERAMVAAHLQAAQQLAAAMR